MNHKPKKILVIRNDKIGDFMLAWPSFALLKKQYPEAEITTLVPEYTARLARQCEWIDTVLIDKYENSFIRDIKSLTKNIKDQDFDVSISLFSEARTAIALWLAGINTRIGPATKIAQVFLNKKLRQKRSESAKPEYEYNLDLVRYYILTNNDTLVTPPRAPYLSFDKGEIDKLRASMVLEYRIPEHHHIIIMHPGTGGSAINLSSTQYAQLADNISQQNDCFFFITAGPGELDMARDMSGQIKHARHHIYESTGGIIDFAKFIDACDIFISGSTGPLHIAGALNIRTIAFYPARRSATALRWQTINSDGRRLHFSPDEYTGDSDMQRIDITLCSREITRQFLRK